MLNNTTILVNKKKKIKGTANVALLITIFIFSFIQKATPTTPPGEFQEKEIKKEETPSINDSIINPKGNNEDNQPLQVTDNKNQENNTISNVGEQIQSTTPQENQKSQTQNTDITESTQIKTEENEKQHIPNIKNTENINKKENNNKGTNTEKEEIAPIKGSSPVAPQIALSAKKLGLTDEKIKKTYSDPRFHKFIDDFLKNVPAADKVIQKSVTTDPHNGIMLLSIFNKIREIQESSLPEAEKEKNITELYKNTNDTIEKSYSPKTPPIVCCASDSQKDTKKVEAMIVEIVEREMILQEKKMCLIAGITVGAIATIGGICTYLAKKKNSDDEKNSDDD